MKTLMAVVILLALSMTAHAAEVEYVTGGVGADDRADMLAKQQDYTLKVTVATLAGDLLADVKLAIDTAKKDRVLDTVMGPILLVKLAPGTYTITATSDDQLPQTKKVTLGKGLTSVDFRWKDAPKD
jgi:hypothetical protein